MKRRPVSKAGSLRASAESIHRTTLIGSGDNDVPVASASRMEPHRSEHLKEWSMHGSPDDTGAPLTSNGTEPDQCKLLFVLLSLILLGLHFPY